MNDLGRRRDDERRKQRPTAPEAHVEVGTQEMRNASNAVVATSGAMEDQRLRRRAPTTRERERRVSDLGRRRDDKQRERRQRAPEAHVEV